MSKSEAVVIESIEVRELLRFLFYLDILNKFSLLQRKHSKYMYAKCLNFPCFITYLAACMHAFCMFYLYVSLGRFVRREERAIRTGCLTKTFLKNINIRMFSRAKTNWSDCSALPIVSIFFFQLYHQSSSQVELLGKRVNFLLSFDDERMRASF